MRAIWSFLGANKDSLTLLLGVLGVIGAVLQYLLTARSTRSAVQIGFLAEVERLQGVIERHREHFQSFKDDPLIPFSTDFYASQIDNVGKIAPRLVPDIIRFYGWVEFLNAVQAARPRYVAHGRLEHFNAFYLAQLEDFCRHFEQPFQAHFRRCGLRPPHPGDGRS